MLPLLQIEQKEIETLEIELKEKVASLSRIKKEFDEMQVLYLVLQMNGSSDCLADSVHNWGVICQRCSKNLSL